MKKQVIMYQDGTTSYIHGNITVSRNGNPSRQVIDTIDIDDDFGISDDEFKELFDSVKKIDKAKFLIHIKQKRDSILQKRQKDAIIN